MCLTHTGRIEKSPYSTPIHNQDIPNPCHHRLVIDGQQRLGDDQRDGVEPRASAAGEDDALHGASCVRAGSSSVMQPRSLEPPTLNCRLVIHASRSGPVPPHRSSRSRCTPPKFKRKSEPRLNVKTISEQRDGSLVRKTCQCPSPA